MEEYLYFFSFFALGTVCASFMSLVSARLYTGAPIFIGRSRCDSCGDNLGLFDLTPIISWCLSLGRCRMCKSKVSPLSTIVEIGLGLLFVIAYLKIGISLPLLGMLVALTLLTGIVVYDLAHSMIPPVMLVPFVIVSGIFACMTISQTELLLQTIGIALGIAGFIAGIHVFSRGRAMGFADIPLAFGLSLLAGPMTFSGLIFSFWIGSVIGIYILAKTPPGSRMGIEVPFAPFLAAGFLLAYFTSWDAFTLVGNILGGYAGI